MARDNYTEPITRTLVINAATDAEYRVLEPLGNVDITVYGVNEDGTRKAVPANLYADRGPTDVSPHDNPFVTPADGKIDFWAEVGDYDLVFHDRNVPARIGDQSIGWQALSGADKGIPLAKLPEGGNSLVPTGTVFATAAINAPAGFLFCYGQVLPIAANQALSDAIGTAYNIGGEGSGNFRLPDYRGRAIFGADNMGGAQADRIRSTYERARGGKGGSDRITLQATEMPVHAHGTTETNHHHDVTDGQHKHRFESIRPGGGAGDGNRLVAQWNSPFGGDYDQAGQIWYTTSNVTVNDNKTSLSINNAGGSSGATQHHENMPPYQICNVIIKT